MKTNYDLPEDVQKYIYAYQGKKKEEKSVSFYSLDKAIAAIIREHWELTEENEKLRQQIEELKKT